MVPWCDYLRVPGWVPSFLRRRPHDRLQEHCELEEAPRVPGRGEPVSSRYAGHPEPRGDGRKAANGTGTFRGTLLQINQLEESKEPEGSNYPKAKGRDRHHLFRRVRGD